MPKDIVEEKDFILKGCDPDGSDFKFLEKIYKNQKKIRIYESEGRIKTNSQDVLDLWETICFMNEKGFTRNNESQYDDICYQFGSVNFCLSSVKECNCGVIYQEIDYSFFLF